MGLRSPRWRLYVRCAKAGVQAGSGRCHRISRGGEDHSLSVAKDRLGGVHRSVQRDGCSLLNGCRNELICF